MKKRVISWVLTLAMLFQFVPSVTFAVTQDLGSVRVIVENNTCTAGDSYCWQDGAEPWTGERVNTQVPLTQDSTMTTCVVEALGTGHTCTGADKDFITEIDGLIGGESNGWLCSLNDWFMNESMGEFTVASGRLKDGDEIRMTYSMRNFGEDVGSIAKDATKTLETLEVAGATLDTDFTAADHSYELQLGAGVTSGSVTLIPRAYNRNFQVRIYKSEAYDASAEGFRRGTEIPVSAGDTLQIVVGDPQWPSMSNGSWGADAEKVPAGVYTFTVVEQSAEPAVTFDSFFTDLAGIASVENDADYPMAVFEDGSALVSTNAHKSSSRSGVTLTAEKTCEISFDYKTSCEKNFDFLEISLNNKVLNKGGYGETALQKDFSGEMSEFRSYQIKLSAGDKLRVCFAKDYSGQSGQDCVWLKNFSASLPYAVTFHANDGTEATAEQGIFGTAALNANTFVREGYRFEGWAETPEGDVVYADGADITLTGNVDLYAVWTAVWTVSFPNMPAGAVISVKDSEGVLQTAREGGTYLLSDGTYTYSAELFGYAPARDVSFTVSGADRTIAEGLTQNAVYTVRFAITPAEAVPVITLKNSEGTEMTAAEDGSYSLPDGTYTYEIKAAGYVTVKDSLTVDHANREIPVALEVSHVWDGSEATKPAQKDGVYQIGTGAELAWFAQQINGGTTASAVLTKDVQLNVPEETPVNVWTPIGTTPFAGSFDGAGHTISGVYIPKGNYVGLFGSIAADGSVSNLTITGSSVTGTVDVGLLAGINNGRISGVTVSNSTVTGKESVGGIAGLNENTITCCANFSAEVVQNESADKGIGGIVGLNNGSVTMSCNQAQLSRTYPNANYAYFGGIAGNNTGTVDSCYNTGTIPVVYRPGGIVGTTGTTSTISNCYNAGTVTKGGRTAIRGYSTGSVENCFYLDSCGATDNQSTEMTAEALAGAAAQLGGAFQEDLQVPINQGFPILKWQNPSAVYTITLTVTPADALVELKNGDQVLEPTAAEAGVYTFADLSSGEYTYSVSLESGDYEPQTGTIHLGMSDAAKTIELAVRRYPVTFTVTPADAQVTVKDSRNTVITGQANPDAGTVSFALPAGTYTYTCEKFGFTTQTDSFAVEKAPVERKLTLTASENHALSIDGLPEGAVLTVSHPEGGRQTADSQGIYHLADGTYTYTVTCEGYVNLAGTVDMAGQDNRLTLTMQHLAVWTGSAATGFAVGSGTEADPYQISSPEELAFLAQAVNGENRADYKNCFFLVTNDLDLGSVAFTPIGSDYICSFVGTFDGGGKVISNLLVDAADRYAGLFGYVGAAHLRNVVVKNAVVTAAGDYAGALIGYDGSDESTVDHCAVLGAEVMSDSNAGILQGYANTQTITDSYAIGNAGVNLECAGAFGGYGSGVTISNCFARGSVMGGDCIGGLIGKDQGRGVQISNTYVSVDVTCDAGDYYGPMVTRDNYNNNYSNVYYNTDSVCQGTGKPEIPYKLEGKTAAEMKSDEFVTLLNAGGEHFARLQSELTYVNDGFPYLTGTYHETVVMEKLETPTGLAWNGKVLSWTAVANASGYRVTLYRDGTSIAEVEVTEAAADFTRQISYAGTGSYTADVQALGDGVAYGTGDVSQRSPAAEITVAGAEISFHVTASNGSFREGDPKIVLTDADAAEITVANDTTRFLPEGTYSYKVTAATFTEMTGKLVVSAQAQTLNVTMEYDSSWDGVTTLEPATEGSVYQISNGYELAWFRDHVNESVANGRNSTADAVLTADIDLGGHSWDPIGTFTSTSATCGYNGTFDGAGHRVDGLFIDTTERCSGLFGYVYTRGVIKNLTVAGSVSGAQYTAGIAAILAGGRVENCVNEAEVTAANSNYAAGITSYMTNYSDKSAVVTGCTNRGAVSGSSYVGGVVGNASNGREVSCCRNSGTVSGKENAAGVAGSSSLPIRACSNSGAVTASAGRVGGITGFVNKAVEDCYNTGAITGVSKANYGVGGIAGHLHSDYGGKLTRAYNAGVITDTGADNVGALVGSKGLVQGVTDTWFAEGTAAQGIGVNADQADVAVSVTAEELATRRMAAILGGSFTAPAAGGTPVLSWEDPAAEVVTAIIPEPADAQVTVTNAAGQTVSPTAEANVWALEDGTYTYRVSKDKFNTVQDTIVVSGKSQAVRVTLEEQTFAVTFTVTPEDAVITVKDEEGTVVPAGEANYQLSNGKYTYTVEKFGYIPSSGSFTVEGKDVQVPAVTLKAAPVHAVTLNITYAGQTPADTAVTVKCGELTVGSGTELSLPDGSYTYRITASGYFTAEGSFDVAGADQTVSVEMAVRSTWDGKTVKEPALENGMYQIAGAEELAWFARQVNDGQTGLNAILLADIFINDELSSNVWTPISNFEKKYTGTFDGNGKAVRGLNAALFGYGGEGSMIKNVTVFGTNKGDSNVGGVCNASYGSFENCVSHMSVTTTDKRTGGITGVLYSTGHITNCANYGTITSSCTGGEYQDYGTVYLGGIVGYAYGEVTGCANFGTVEASGVNYGGIGGIAGVTDAAVTASYNMGHITGPKRVAGIAGIANKPDSRIANCYNAGTITCTGSSHNPFGGAVAGSVSNSNGDTVGTVVNTYFLKDSYYFVHDSQTIHNGGIGYGSGESVSKTEAEMKEDAFVRSLGEAFRVDGDGKLNGGYPVLAWQGGRAPEATADEKDVAQDKLDLTVTPSLVTESMTLELAKTGTRGSAIAWTSDHPQIISNEGVVTLPDSGTVVVTLTAVLTKGEATDTRSFEITVQSRSVTDQKYLEGLKAKLENANLKPVYGSDTNMVAVFRSYAEGKDETLPENLQITLTNVGRNTNPADSQAHIAEDGTITYFYQDPATCAMWGATIQDMEFTLTLGDVSVVCKASARISWDVDLVHAEMQKIADALTFDVIKGQNTSADAVTSELTLPGQLENFNWSLISWTSSDSAVTVRPGQSVLDNATGKINPNQKDTAVTLTALITFNKTGLDEAEITLSKDLEITVTGSSAGRHQKMQQALDAYTLDKVKVINSEQPIDPAAVTTDMQLLTPRKLGLDGKDFAVTVETGSDTVTVNGYRANVFRPMPGEQAVQVPLTAVITHKESGDSMRKELGTVTILPLTEAELTLENELMNYVKTHFFDGIRNENLRPDAVTGDLHPFQEAYRTDSGVAWVYDYKDRTYTGIKPTDIPKEGYDESYNLYHSSNTAVIRHENLLVTVPEYNTEVTITACLTSQEYGRYAERYPDNELVKNLANQMVSLTVTVRGSNADQQAANAVADLIDAIGNVTLDSYSAIAKARDAFDKLTDEQKALVNNEDVLIAAEEAYAQLLRPELPFTDVKPGQWFYDEVQYAYAHDLIKGVTKTEFAPYQTGNRAMFTKLLYRLSGSVPVTGEHPFTDVASGAWYEDAVIWAYQNKIVFGTSKTEFDPYEPISRQQAVAILMRYAAYCGFDVSASADISGYADADQVSPFAQNAVRWAVGEKLLAGRTGNVLDPKGSITRGEMTAVFVRYMERVVKAQS